MRGNLNTATVEDVVSIALLNISNLVNLAEVETCYIISCDSIFLKPISSLILIWRTYKTNLILDIISSTAIMLIPPTTLVSIQNLFKHF